MMLRWGLEPPWSLCFEPTMIPIRTIVTAAALAALSACTQQTSNTGETPGVDLSKKAKVVTFDVSGMT